MIQSIDLFRTEVAFVWKDKSTTIIKNFRLRQLCPCAFCSGERDVFGNQYGGNNIKKEEDIKIIRFDIVGHYGLQFFFSDGHKDGIYTFSFLKSLGKG